MNEMRENYKKLLNLFPDNTQEGFGEILYQFYTKNRYWALYITQAQIVAEHPMLAE